MADKHADSDRKIPKFSFSKWVPWEERTRLLCADKPGIYLLMKNSKVPKGPAGFKNSNVIYIGETGQELKERWDQFARSATTGVKGHSGGKTYYKKLGGDMKNLHLAAMGLQLKPPYAGPIRLFLERKLIMEYVFQHKRLPLCNKK